MTDTFFTPHTAGAARSTKVPSPALPDVTESTEVPVRVAACRHRRVPLRALLIATLVASAWCAHAVAAGSTQDILAGTTQGVTDTIAGSGKTWLYLMEGVSAVMAYIRSKNVFVFGGIAMVALFLNVLLHLASGA